MSQLEYIEAIEKRLWSAADNLRANSNYASKEYFLPVVGLVFLRHAYSRYLMIKARTVPCELWFLNRDKPKAHKDKVLMLDARNVYRAKKGRYPIPQ